MPILLLLKGVIMSYSRSYFVIFCLIFIGLSINAMEETNIVISIPYYNEFKTILTTHYPLAKAVPHIKQLQNQNSKWKDILENKTACDKLLKFASVLELSHEPKITNAVFIGTPGMIECARDYIKNDPSAERHLSNMLVDTGSWLDQVWENQATDVAYAIIQATKNPDTTDENGETALINATKNGNFQITQMLLSVGASPTAQNKHGETALTVVKKILDTTTTYKSISVLLRIAEKLDTSSGK